VFQIFATRVAIHEGDPVGVATEGLVIPANDHLWMGAGPAMKLKQAGGEAIEVEAVRQGPVALGQAVPTAAGSLGYRRNYHAVVMGQDLKVRTEQIRPALTSALQQASREKLVSLGIAPLESEEMTGPFRLAAREIVSALFDLLSESTPLKEVWLLTQKPEARQTYREAFLEVLGHGGP
jgi:O-acetyl-ADP-ribose deacetylase (regulator of RNase III)